MASLCLEWGRLKEETEGEGDEDAARKGGRRKRGGERDRRREHNTFMGVDVKLEFQ